MVAANRISQRVAHSSTRRNAGELIFRVRDGYGRQPHRYGRLTLSRGVEPRWYTALSVANVIVRAIQFAPGLVQRRVNRR